VWHTKGFVTRYRQPSKLFSIVQPLAAHDILETKMKIRPKSSILGQIKEAKNRRIMLEIPTGIPWHPVDPVYKQFGSLPREYLDKIKF
jgi:hypothetical protein